MNDNIETHAVNPNDSYMLEVFGIDNPDKAHSSWFHCQRHDIEKEQDRLRFHTNDAVYIVGDDYTAISCPLCRRDFAFLYSAEALEEHIALAMARIFTEWDNGECADSMFKYVCEKSEFEAEK